MPVTPQASATPTHPQQAGMDKEEATCNDISQIYQIFPDEVLGSGQFGIVYGGKCVRLLSSHGHGGIILIHIVCTWVALLMDLSVVFS